MQNPSVGSFAQRLGSVTGDLQSPPFLRLLALLCLNARLDVPACLPHRQNTR